jgi:serine/threonine-protein phosphatase 6 regulatory ankyrin repeat subunit B
MLASENGHADVVKELLVKGANVNLQARDGTMALSAASKEGHTDIVRLLINAGAKK